MQKDYSYLIRQLIFISELDLYYYRVTVANAYIVKSVQTEPLMD